MRSAVVITDSLSDGFQKHRTSHSHVGAPPRSVHYVEKRLLTLRWHCDCEKIRFW